MYMYQKRLPRQGSLFKKLRDTSDVSRGTQGPWASRDLLFFHIPYSTFIIQFSRQPHISSTFHILSLQTPLDMNPILRNVLAVIAGAVIGGAVNMGLITIGPEFIPLPEGIDPNDMASLEANAHLMETKHFLFPFLAHALGTLVGAFLAAKFGASRQMMLALIIGAFFLAGGITAASMIPSPTWFIVSDLALAYIPMAWLGWKLAGSPTNT